MLLNKYPIFIPSKGRADTIMTMKAFDNIGVKYSVVVEPQQYEDYAKVIKDNEIIITPHVDKGLCVTRNFIWDYAESQGYEKFWTFDDNILDFYRLNKNQKIKLSDGTFLRIIEDFIDRYENVPLAGMNYDFFCKQNQKLPPYYLNTRVYSNMLINTFVKDSKGNKIRNELFYNDDTDLCLRIMKQGYCIFQINAFLIGKAQTMTIKGGMTDYYKSKECDGRLKFAEELQKAHSDVVEVTWKFGRWHHQVDYRAFQFNKLKKKENLIIKDQINNYGLFLKQVSEVIDEETEPEEINEILI